MADDSDITQDRLEIEERIRKRYTQKTTQEIDASGFCLECDEELPPAKRWCNADCRDMWEVRRKNK